MHDRLDPLLLTQHALVTRRQGWEVGVTKNEFDSLIERKLLLPLHRGVFRDPAAPQSIDQRALAAVLAAGAGSVVSHRLAVALEGMRNYKCSLMEITSPGIHRIPGVTSHRSQRPPAQQILRGVPVTTAARTIVDVAPLVSGAVLQRWIETWLSSRTLELADLESMMDSLKGHRGVPLTRAALTDRTLLHAATDSAPEAALGLLVETLGLPPLTLHHLVTTSSGFVFELDWSYPEWMIAFEMDGFGVHMRSLDAFDRDRFRRNELVIDGWHILNFTKRQVERRQKTVLNQIERIIRDRL